MRLSAYQLFPFALLHSKGGTWLLSAQLSRWAFEDDSLIGLTSRRFHRSGSSSSPLPSTIVVIAASIICALSVSLL